MKKILSTIIALSMILSMFSVMNVFAEEKLIASESFEDGLGSWSVSTAAEVAISFTDDATDGKKALKFVDDGDNFAPSTNSAKFDVVPGETYKLTLDYKHVSGSPFGFAIRFLDSEGKKISDARKSTKASSEWGKLEIEGIAPEDAFQAIILLAGNKATVCEMLCDNVKVYTTATAGASSDAQAAKPVTGDMLFTDSFENGMDLWKAFSKNGAEFVNIDSKEASDGKNSLHMTDSDEATAPAYIMKEYVPVEPGKKYNAYCDYKCVSGDSFKMILRFFDAENKKISDKTIGSKNTDWTPLSISLTAPENAASCAILLAGYTKNLGEAYIDNVKLTIESDTAAIPETKLDKINKNSIVLFIGSPNALVNGTKTLIDKTNDKVIADTVNSRTLVPVRFIAENYGAEVGWDEATETVTLKMTDKVVTIVLNKNEIKINDKVVTIDVPAQTIEGRTMLPLRAFVEEVMGKTIFWDDRGLIVITNEAILTAEDATVINEIINKIK